MKNFFTLFITAIFFNFALTQDVILSVDGSDLLYESTSDISGIQFNHDGCASSASGGDAASNGFVLSVTNSIVLGFSFTGASIPAGDGVLVNLGSDDCTSDSFSGFVFAGPGG